MTSTRLRALALAIAVLASAVAVPASADPVIVATVHLTDRFTANPLGSLPDGDFVQIGAIVLGASTTDAFSSLIVTATRGADTVPLPFFPFTAPIIVDPAYLAFIPFVVGDPTGTWSITATDSMGTSAAALTPEIADPELVPFVTDVMVSDASTTPTVSWTLPDLTDFDVNFTRLRIIDAMTEVQIFAPVLPTVITSFMVPPGLLTPGRSYIYRVSLEDLDLAEVNIENRSNAFSAVTQVVPEPGTLMLVLSGLAGLGIAGWRSRGKRHEDE